MSATADSAPRIGALGRINPRPIVWALGLTQIIGYGTLYYAFSVLAPAMAEDLGWATEWIYGAFSLALLAGGLVAPWAGRLMDARGAGFAMAWGSASASVALVCTALAPGALSFFVGLLAIEMASALVLYDAAFAALVQSDARTARRDITQLTLIAGFASTLFWPATSALHQVLDWRSIYLIFAVLNLLLCLPIHVWIARSRGWVQEREGSATATLPKVLPRSGAGTLHGSARRSGFLLVAAGFSLGGFVLSSILVHMVPVLAALGHGTNAALIGMVFGPAQVLGRLTNMMFGSSLHPVRLAILSSALLSAAMTLLIVLPSAFAAGVLFALVLGLGSGLKSITRGTVPLVLFGETGYGARLGQFAAIQLVLSSAAPFGFALAAEQAGMSAALALLAALAMASAAAFTWAERLPRSPTI
jgi:hypothetical protein